jgi:phosphoglycolate phosphatase
VSRRNLFLFDIDGTLISTGGAGSQAMRQAFAALWRLEDGFSRIEFSGRTDRAILRDAWTVHGVSRNPFERDVDRFKRAYLRRLPRTLVECDGRVLPGVVETLELLSDNGNATVALATGNFKRGAGLKLKHYGIAHHFRAGGFGDSAENRVDMLEQALKACRPLGRHGTVFVIGDTVHDIACAKAHAAVAVGVTTGPSDAAALSAAGADVVLETMAEAPKHLPIQQ